MPRTVSIAVDQEIGARIRDARVAAGLSQEKLDAALGVTFQQVQKYEKGTNRVSASTLLLISSALGVDYARFLEGLTVQLGRAA